MSTSSLASWHVLLQPDTVSGHDVDRPFLASSKARGTEHANLLDKETASSALGSPPQIHCSIGLQLAELAAFSSGKGPDGPGGEARPVAKACHDMYCAEAMISCGKGAFSYRQRRACSQWRCTTSLVPGPSPSRSRGSRGPLQTSLCIIIAHFNSAALCLLTMLNAQKHPATWLTAAPARRT